MLIYNCWTEDLEEADVWFLPNLVTTTPWSSYYLQINSSWREQFTNRLKKSRYHLLISHHSINRIIEWTTIDTTIVITIDITIDITSMSPLIWLISPLICRCHHWYHQFDITIDTLIPPIITYTRLCGSHCQLN